jgi:hypothetical protein
MVLKNKLFIISTKKYNKPTKKSSIKSTIKLAKKPVKKLAKKPVKKPVKKPDKKPVKKPDKKPDKKPVKKPDKKLDKKPVKKQNKKSVEKPVKKQDKKLDKNKIKQRKDGGGLFSNFKKKKKKLSKNLDDPIQLIITGYNFDLKNIIDLFNNIEFINKNGEKDLIATFTNIFHYQKKNTGHQQKPYDSIKTILYIGDNINKLKNNITKEELKNFESKRNKFDENYEKIIKYLSKKLKKYESTSKRIQKKVIGLLPIGKRGKNKLQKKYLKLKFIKKKLEYDYIIINYLYNILQEKLFEKYINDKDMLNSIKILTKEFNEIKKEDVANISEEDKLLFIDQSRMFRNDIEDYFDFLYILNVEFVNQKNLNKTLKLDNGLNMNTQTINPNMTQRRLMAPVYLPYQPAAPTQSSAPNTSTNTISTRAETSQYQ